MQKQSSGHSKASRYVCFVVALSLLFLCACSHINGKDAEPSARVQPFTGEAAVIATWQGDYPVARLSVLPEDPVSPGIGHIADRATLEAVWAAFKPGETVPEVDFDLQLLVFVRNVEYYNLVRIGKIKVLNGVAEVLAMQTLSARPIEDVVAVSMALIRREGIAGLKVSGGVVKVEDRRDTKGKKEK